MTQLEAATAEAAEIGFGRRSRFIGSASVVEHRFQAAQNPGEIAISFSGVAMKPTVVGRIACDRDPP